MTMQDKLTRWYQKECRNVILDKWLSGEKQVGYCVLPTGTGKTRIFTNLDLPNQKRTLILVEKIALMEQLLSNLDNNTSSSMIGNKHKPSNKELINSDIVVATVQTLSKDNYINTIDASMFDLIIIDECHHASGTNCGYSKVVNYFNYKLCVGFTATPAKYSDIFDYKNQWYNYTIYDAWTDGFLVKPKCYLLELTWDKSKLNKVLNKSLHQWTDKDISDALTENATTNYSLILSQLMEVNNAERSVVYFSSRELAKGFAAYCGEQCIECHSITSDTSTTDRETYINRFKQDRNVILSNVYVLAEGIDIPEIETILVARPTENINLYKQIVGRALRICDGKSMCNIIDCFAEQNGYLFQHTFTTAFLDVSLSNEVSYSKDFIESTVSQLNCSDGDVKSLNDNIKDSIDICYNLLEQSKLYIDTMEVPYYLDERKGICYGGCSLFSGRNYSGERKIRWYIKLTDDCTGVKYMRVNAPGAYRTYSFDKLEDCFKLLYDEYYSDDRCVIPYKYGGGSDKLSLKQYNLLVDLIHQQYDITSDISNRIVRSINKRRASELISKLLLSQYIEKYMMVEETQDDA